MTKYWIFPLLAFVAACTTTQLPPPAEPAVEPKTTTSTSSTPVVRPDDVSRRAQSADNPAVDTLLARADSLADSGNSEAALAAAERAQRMAPRDPRVYLQLAQLRLRRNERLQAEQLALKGLSLGPDDAVRDDLERVLRASRGA